MEVFSCFPHTYYSYRRFSRNQSRILLERSKALEKGRAGVPAFLEDLRMQLTSKWALGKPGFLNRWTKQKTLRNEVAKGHSWTSVHVDICAYSWTLGRERLNRGSRVKIIMQIQETPGDKRLDCFHKGSCNRFFFLSPRSTNLGLKKMDGIRSNSSRIKEHHGITIWH